MRREQAEWVARIHHKRLLVGHLAQILHCEPVLCPVLEYGSVAAVHYQFVRMLRHLGVEIVLNHQHYSSRLLRMVRILVDGSGVHLITRTVAIHVYATVVVKLVDKLGCQFRMQMLWEIAQSVAQSKLSLLMCQYLLALRRMIYIVVVGLLLR